MLGNSYLLTEKIPTWYGTPAKKKSEELPFYWSATRHNMLKSCPSCFYRKYIKKEQEDPFKDKKHIYGYGELVHYVIELAIKGEDLPEEAEIAARAGLEYIDQIETHVRLLKEKLDTLGLRDGSPEKEFLTWIRHPENPNEFLDIPLYGIIDLSKILSNDGLKGQKMRIADFKSGTTKWTKSKCMNSYQFKGYCYFGWAVTGEIPMIDVISLIKKNGNKDATVSNQPVEFTMKDLVGFYEDTKRGMSICKDMMEGKYNLPSCSNNFFCPYR